MVASLVFAIFAIFFYLVGGTVMGVVLVTRVRHPVLKVYIKLLLVLLAHWILSATLIFAGEMVTSASTMAEFLMLPGSPWWVALASIPERFLLAWEIYLTLLCGILGTKGRSGRKGRRALLLVFWVVLTFMLGERLVNLLYWSAPLGDNALALRNLWRALGNDLSLTATAVATVWLIRSKDHVLFAYLGSSYRSLGWGLATYLAIIAGLAVAATLPGNLLGAVSQAILYLVAVGLLLVILGFWNLRVGSRILSTSLPERQNRQLRQPTVLSTYGLSTRETEIVLSLAQGLVNKEVAALLHLSESTVKNHVYNIYRKLGISNRSGLVRILAQASRPTG